ncbi:MAG: TRAP transporter small permease [Desulfarculus sp.]|jgi:C4-dicarboxylate transporter DctQ subunit|nr:MAG: TRAP transporter small permease [Desulfarculus sp.]
MKNLMKIINHIEEGVLALGLLALALMAFGEVVTRYLFNHSFTWFEEFSRYFCVFLTFLGASLGVKYGLHFSMDYLVTRVSLRNGHLMRIAGCLISAVFFSMVAWYGWQHALRLKKFGTTSAAMGLPMFWAYLPIAVFSAILVIRFLIQAWRHAAAYQANLPLPPPGGGRE